MYPKFEDIVLINKLAKSNNINVFMKWFLELDHDIATNILDILVLMIGQAKVMESDVPAAIQLSGLRSTFTPCVMLTRNCNLHNLKRIPLLPQDEHEKSAALLFTLFHLADRRRREMQCGGGCTHWWHRDLEDPDVVADILRSRSSL